MKKSNHGKHERQVKIGEGFAKKYPFFIFGAIVALVIIVLAVIIFVGQTQKAINPDPVDAKLMFSDNQALMDYSIASIDYDLNSDTKTEMENYYALSLRDDLVWLKEKEKEIYSGFQSNAYGKEVGFTIFMYTVMQLSQESSIDLGDTLYEATIEDAKNKNAVEVKSIDEYNSAFMILEEEAISKVLPNEQMKAIALAELNSLIQEYISYKKGKLGSGVSIKQDYVEANKITFLTYELAFLAE